MKQVTIHKEVNRRFPGARGLLLVGFCDVDRIDGAVPSGDVHEVFPKPWDNGGLAVALLSR